MEDEIMGLRPGSTMDRVYDLEEEYYFLKTETKIKDTTKDIIKTKLITKPITNRRWAGSQATP